MSPYIIYGLVDPRDGLIRYVGKSTWGLKRPNAHRLKGELRRSNVKNDWLIGLFAAGYDYDIVVLDEFENPELPGTLCHWWTGINATLLPDAERWWIAYGRACGWPLTNLTNGGGGMSGWSPSTDTRRRIGDASRGKYPYAAVAVTKGVPLTQEHKDRIGRAQLGVPKSAEACHKMSTSHTGKLLSERHKDNIRKTNTGKVMSAETRRRMSAAASKREASKRLRST